MPHDAVRLRVSVAVTRDSPRGRELLVFAHRDVPEAGTQMPGGGVEPGESVEAAAVREVAEETGVTDVEVRGRIGIDHRPTAEGRPQHTVVVHAGTTERRDAWQHVVAGDGDDQGLVLEVRFVPVSAWPCPDTRSRAACRAGEHDGV